jgi:hypothetical protein
MAGAAKSRKKKGPPGENDTPIAVETEVTVKDRVSASAFRPGMPLTAPVPVAHCYRCKRKDILVMAVVEGKMVGLCPDHFKLDVMTYVP